MAGLAASWGLVAVLASSVDLGSAALAFARLALGAVTITVMAVAQGSIRSFSPGGRLPALVLIGSMQGVHWLLFFVAVKLGSVALAVITFYAAPVVIAAAAPMVIGEARDRFALLALVPGMAGVVLVALGGDRGGAFSFEAVAAGLGSAATFAALILMNRRLLLAAAPPLTVAFWACSVGTIVVAPFLVTGDRLLPGGGGDWAAVLALGIVFTGLSSVVHAWLLRRVTAQISSVLTFLEPVVAVAIAATVLDEEIGGLTVFGGVLVLAAGLGVVCRRPRAAPVRTDRGVGSPA
jgi:drug/metabolite transporter, DME family